MMDDSWGSGYEITSLLEGLSVMLMLNSTFHRLSHE